MGGECQSNGPRCNMGWLLVTVFHMIFFSLPRPLNMRWGTECPACLLKNVCNQLNGSQNLLYSLMSGWNPIATLYKRSLSGDSSSTHLLIGPEPYCQNILFVWRQICVSSLEYVRFSRTKDLMSFTFLHFEWNISKQEHLISEVNSLKRSDSEIPSHIISPKTAINPCTY